MPSEALARLAEEALLRLDEGERYVPPQIIDAIAGIAAELLKTPGDAFFERRRIGGRIAATLLSLAAPETHALALGRQRLRDLQQHAEALRQAIAHEAPTIPTPPLAAKILRLPARSAA